MPEQKPMSLALRIFVLVVAWIALTINAEATTHRDVRDLRRGHRRRYMQDLTAQLRSETS